MRERFFELTDSVNLSVGGSGIESQQFRVSWWERMTLASVNERQELMPTLAFVQFKACHSVSIPVMKSLREAPVIARNSVLHLCGDFYRGIVENITRITQSRKILLYL